MSTPPRAGAAMRFYRTVSTKVSVGEYWRLAPGPIVFLIMVRATRARVPMPLGGGFPYVERLDVLSYRDLPQMVRDAWGEILPACREQGLSIQLIYTVPVLGVDKESYGAAMLGDNGD